MKTFLLVTNVSDQTYWVYIGTKYNTSGNLRAMVEKYGDIYINAKGGWFNKSAIKTIHSTVIQENFPTE